MMPFYFDSTYILVLIGMAISMIASAKVSSTFSKYSTVRSQSGYSGAQAARMILDSNGLNHVKIVPIPGQLTDNYNRLNKTLSLSQSVYGNTSLSAVAVAAHECGHAIQDQREYLPFNLRGAIVPIVNIGQTVSMPILIAGVIMGSYDVLVPLGIFLFSLSLIFQIVTLPVEFNASSRAMDAMQSNGLISQEEVKGAKAVLSAAALTYVAGVIASLLSLLRIMILFGGRRKGEE